MQTVELRLPPAELSARMAAMRTWLDEHRCEPKSFACDDSATEIRVAVTFRVAGEAAAFASCFAGRLQAAEAALDGGFERETLSPADLVG